MSNICSPEVASSDQSPRGTEPEENSATDSESEASLSQELSTQRDRAASLWAGHLAKTSRSLSAVLSVEEPLILNITDTLLSSLHGLVTEDSFKPSEASLVNSLGVEGEIVYTEIKVMINVLKLPLRQNGQERIILQLEEESENSSE